MRKLFVLALVLTLMVSCKREASAPQAAAERYYGYLAKGDVDAYMRGMADYDQLPEEYRSQLRDMFLQYLDHERQERNGILSAKALRDTLVTPSESHVFLEVQFGDSTCEQVSLPLVLTDKGWRMK